MKLEPVSYTHLDVYKRQCIDSVARSSEISEDLNIFNIPENSKFGVNLPNFFYVTYDIFLCHISRILFCV